MRLLVAALLAFALVACNDREAERQAAKAHQEAEKAHKDAVTTRLGPDVRKLLAKVDLLRPALAGVPKAAEGAEPPSTEPRMKLSENDMKDPAGNTDLLFQEELTLRQRGMLGTCGYYLQNPSSDDSADLLEDVLNRGLRTRYFLVVRADQKKKPKITGGNSYSDGSLEGDVVVFDLASDPPKALGSFPLRSELTSTVKVSANANQESIQYALDEALRKTALDEIEKLLKR